MYKKNIIKTDVWPRIKVIYIVFLFSLKWTHPRVVTLTALLYLWNIIEIMLCVLKPVHSSYLSRTSTQQPSRVLTLFFLPE